MTLFPFRRKDDISLEDELDAWLNARTSGVNGSVSQPEGESMAGVAYEFHAWADSAPERDPSAKGPADDLWNRILHEQRVEQRRDSEGADEMSTTIGAPVGGYAPPRSNRTRRAEATPPSSRAGAWFNAIAAALLVLTLGGGAYLARNGGFGFGGGGGDESGRFAAQVVSPEASPGADSAICGVEPLTTEQILAYVENPHSYMPYGVFGTPSPEEEGQVGEITQGLFEYPMPWQDLTENRSGGVPSEDTFEEAISIADQYYACERYGTVAQRWALMTPPMVQQEVLIHFPVYRDRQEIIEYIESVHDRSFLRMPASDDDSLLDRSLFPNPNIRDARAFEYRADWMLMDADLVIYIGQEFRDGNGEIVGVSSWDGTPLVGGSEHSNGGMSLILVHSESTDRWFVYGGYAPRG